jgi:hypothetical protein
MTQPGHALAALAGYPRPTSLGNRLLAWWSADHDHESVAATTYQPDMSVTGTGNWAHTNIAVTGGQAEPDGGNNAFLLTDSATSGEHSVDETTPGASTNLIQVTLWLKSGTFTRARVLVGTLSGAGQGCVFNIGTNGFVLNGGARAYHIATDGSWKKIVIFAEVDAQFFRINIVNNAGATSYSGAGDTIYAYAPAGSYRARLIQDADGVSPDVSSSAWGKLNATVTGGHADPFGGTDAYMLVDDATSGAHQVEDTTTNAIAGLPMRWEPWLKADALANCQIYMGTVSGGAVGVIANIRIASGEIISATGDIAATQINSVGDWKQWRFEGAPTASVRARVRLLNNAESATYAGTGQGIYVYTPLGSYQQRRLAHMPIRTSRAAYANIRGAQATDSKRPILTADHFSGTKSLLFSGAQALVFDALLTSPVYDYVDSPWTFIALLHSADATSGQTLVGLGDATATATRIVDVGNTRIATHAYDDAGIGNVQTHHFPLLSGYCAVAVTWSTAARSAFLNGKINAGDPAATAYSTASTLAQLTIGALRASAGETDYARLRLREFAIVAGEMTPAEIRLQGAGMRARARVSPL